MTTREELSEEKTGEITPVRTLVMEDLDTIVRIEKRIIGQSRRAYFEAKLREAERDSSIMVSLGAEHDGMLAGFLMGRVYYGEYGIADTVATIDTIGVDPLLARQGIAGALLAQFATNMKGLGVEKIRTHTDWNEHGLNRFFDTKGFRPAPRLCLELPIDATEPQ